MSDPWEDVREHLDKPRGEFMSEGPMLMAADARGLLDDADALLADNKLLREALYEVAHGKHSGRAYANKVLSESALPEHLK